MLRIRMVQLVFFFMFVAVTKADAIPIFAANLTNSQENLLTSPSGGGFRPASFGTASFVLNNVVNTPFGSGFEGTIRGKWDATEGNGTTLVAQLPEPASVLLLGIGILIVAFFCRRGLRKR
jgi:hypothetical protein